MNINKNCDSRMIFFVENFFYLKFLYFTLCVVCDSSVIFYIMCDIQKLVKIFRVIVYSIVNFIYLPFCNSLLPSKKTSLRLVRFRTRHTHIIISYLSGRLDRLEILYPHVHLVGGLRLEQVLGARRKLKPENVTPFGVIVGDFDGAGFEWERSFSFECGAAGTVVFAVLH